MNQTMLLLGLLLAAAPLVHAATDAAPESAAKPAAGENVRYRAAQKVDFEALLIEGRLARPEIAVVTGDSEARPDGLIRLRKDFLDRVASDFGEEPRP